MKLTVVILCLLGATAANPILHKVSMEIIDHASNSTSSVSESSEESNTSEHDSSPENTSENISSESDESKSDEQTSDLSHSHSLEERFGTGEPGMTTDNSQGSQENMRKNWVHLINVKMASKEDTEEVTDQPDEEDKDTTEDQTSESSESTEKPTPSSSSSSTEDSRAVVVDSSENSHSNSSSSSSSSESHESSHSTESTESQSKECPPGTDSNECDSDEYQFHDVGDDGATDPFNGFHTPDNAGHEFAFKR
ncbi:secretory calcium-binding phosphoprotein 1 [Astyanax mexicanus]|uniref:secretory calcium-binding phosphoprotein 1 n=1 Tax=Astyanax mexicanus TaxID=7994 RepID=UPI0020CB1216|nr:secretory calcium-binding phosphoprotein 1 [Astyanax mexicanus]